MSTIVHLSADDVALARSWERTVLARLGGKKNYMREERTDRYLVGYIGEIAVALLMDRAGVRYVHRVKLTGRSEGAEFIVYLWGEPMALEVKTGAEPTHRYFVVSALQHDHKSPYFVGCRIERLSDDGAGVSIMGWLERDKVLALATREFRPGHPGYHLPYGELPAMSELFADLDKGEGRREVDGDVLPEAPPPKAPPAPSPRRANLGHPHTPPEVRFPGDRYDWTLDDLKAATTPPPPAGVPTTISASTPRSGMVSWFEHQIAAAKAEHGAMWGAHKGFVVDYLRQEMAEWIGPEAADQVVHKAAQRARA